MTEIFGGGVTISRQAPRPVALVLVGLVFMAAYSAGQPGTRPSRVEALPVSTSLSASSTRPSQGQFLVATRRMGDPRFAQTVILLLEHGENGTLGLVINRPTKVKLSEALPEIKERKGRPEFLFMGGPLQVNAISLLLRSKRQRKDALRVLDGVFFSTSAALLKQMTAKERASARLRALAGHAGWAPGQLDRELKRGDWYVLDAQAEEVFREPLEIWSELIRRAEAKWVQGPGTRSVCPADRADPSAFHLPRRLVLHGEMRAARGFGDVLIP